MNLENKLEVTHHWLILVWVCMCVFLTNKMNEEVK
jgi:hypothetical protein